MNRKSFSMASTPRAFAIRPWTLLGVLFTLPLPAMSQVNDTIHGIVSDSISNQALSSVQVGSEGLSVQTDAGGAFSLVFPGGMASISPKSQSGIKWDPASGYLSLPGLSGKVSVLVEDLSGRAVARYASSGEDGEEINLSDLPKGVFLVTAQDARQTVSIKILQTRNEAGHSRDIAGNSGAAISPARALVTQKVHVLSLVKNGYVPKTVSVAAGTADAPIRIGMVPGDGIPSSAIESIEVPASGVAATFKTSLVKGELYLLKAIGTVSVGSDQVDAEFGGFGAGQAGKDTLGGVDVGIDIGTQTLRFGKTGREKWFGAYNPGHVYYMIVTGTGIPLSLKLVKSGTAAASGAITVAMVRLSPYPPSLAAPLDSLPIPVTKTIVHTKMKPLQSKVYLLQCSGQGKVGGARAGMGDADYMDYDSTTGVGAVDVGDNNTDYGVGVDDSTITHTNPATPRRYWWGPWRKDRFYYTLYTGTGNPIAFMFFDVGYGDNVSSAIKVRVFEVP